VRCNVRPATYTTGVSNGVHFNSVPAPYPVNPAATTANQLATQHYPTAHESTWECICKNGISGRACLQTGFIDIGNIDVGGIDVGDIDVGDKNALLSSTSLTMN